MVKRLFSKFTTQVGVYHLVQEAARFSASRLIEDPFALSERVEKLSPWLSRHVLNFASFWSRAFYDVTRFRLSRLDDQKFVIEWRPRVWPSHGEVSEMTPSFLTAAAEVGLRSFWSRHVDSGLTQFYLIETNLKLFKNIASQIELRFMLRAIEREDFLFQLRKAGSAEWEGVVSVLDSRKNLLAQIRTVWRFHETRTLKPSPP